MPTRRERLTFLIARIDELADGIEETGREDEVIRLAEELKRQPDSLAPMSDLEWDALLPKEQEHALPRYYLTLRAELVSLEREGESQPEDRRPSWLDGRAPKVVSLVVGLGTLVQLGTQVLHAAGVLAQDEDTGQDPLV